MAGPNDVGPRAARLRESRLDQSTRSLSGRAPRHGSGTQRPAPLCRRLGVLLLRTRGILGRPHPTLGAVLLVSRATRRRRQYLRPVLSDSGRDRETKRHPETRSRSPVRNGTLVWKYAQRPGEPLAPAELD